MIVKGPAPDHKVIMEVDGKYRNHPITKEQAWDAYPKYSIESVNGVEEVSEQREPCDILYITDDPKITAVLKKK